MTKYPNNAAAWTLFWLLSFVGLVLFCLDLCEGHLIYSLDDPYIHLAVAKHILHGGYGVNAGEAASPSSSILYPYLLAATMLIGLKSYGALLINMIAMGFAVWLLLDSFWRFVGDNKRQRICAQILSPLLIVAINAYGLPMTGMEHSLHVLAVIVAMRGLVHLYEKKEVTPQLCATIILMPFLRFEGLALSVAAIASMFAVGKKREASWISVVIVSGLGAWALYMHALGLPFLPSSVQMKSDFARGLQNSLGLSGLLKSMAQNVHDSFTVWWGSIFALAIGCFGISFFYAGRKNLKSPHILLSGVALFALTAHMLFGRFGWFNRYEVYAVTIMLIGSIYLLGPSMGCAYEHWPQKIGRIGFIIILACIGWHYAKGTIATPWAARNIYEQQYQMHRFAADYFPHRVAVNDLGWVAYGNDAYVLDLLGLGSEKAREAKLSGPITAEVNAKLVNDADIDYAMIYDVSFQGVIPSGWCKLGIMQTPRVITGAVDVSFYAIKPSVIAEMNQALDRFVPTLPARDAFVRTSCAEALPEDIKRERMKSFLRSLQKKD